MLPSSRPRRRRLPALTALLVAFPALVAGTVGLGASPAQAAPKPFVVIGTSDVFDSHLVQAVIEPGFEAAHPEYDFQYVSKGTGDAINLAKTGAAAAILVHAASLENQFVMPGDGGPSYSAEGFGRAFTYGDFVLAGYGTDGAQVAPAGGVSHDIVDAYQKIAAAGAMNKAQFVSRGGTPGTTVQEHAIWALTTGVTLCDVPADKGGGKTPSTVTGPCPATVPLPSWYTATGDTQANNVIKADACNGFASKDCYVFTDRGTFNYLESTTPPSLANLKVLARDNAASAVGGKDILINNFHAYAVNPARFPDNPGKTDLVGATLLLDYLVSPSTQNAIDSYLGNAVGGAPFKKSAAPVVAATTSTSTVSGSQPVLISGTLANAVPGTPALSGETVKLFGVAASTPDATPTLLDTTTTGSSGEFQFSQALQGATTFTVTTDKITKVERPDLTPVFGDVLQPTSTPVGTVQVLGVIGLQKASKVGADKRSLRVEGLMRPASLGTTAKIVLVGRKQGADTDFVQTGVQPLAANATSFSKTFALSKTAKGTFEYQVRYVNNGVILPGTTRTYTVTLP